MPPSSGELEKDEDGVLNIEVFDYDQFGDDDLLGMNGLYIEEHLLANAGRGPHRYLLPLNTQGSIELSVDVSSKVEHPMIEYLIASLISIDVSSKVEHPMIEYLIASLIRWSHLSSICSSSC